MQSKTTRQFWRLLSELPIDVQRDAQRAYRLFQSNPAHPGLHFKKLEGDDDLYSARIGLDHRALAVMRPGTSSREDRLVWYWIESHSDYDRLIGPRQLGLLHFRRRLRESSVLYRNVILHLINLNGEAPVGT